jgi:hypothetical protein
VRREIIVHNAKQFDYHIFKDFRYQMGVQAAFTSVYHPQSIGAVEKANALIFTAIQKILKNQPKGKWAEKLPRAVWSHNTSVCRATEFTPFKLLCGEGPVTQRISSSAALEQRQKPFTVQAKLNPKTCLN